MLPLASEGRYYLCRIALRWIDSVCLRKIPVRLKIMALGVAWVDLGETEALWWLHFGGIEDPGFKETLSYFDV